MLFVDGPKWSVLGDAGVGKDDIELALLFFDLFDNSADARLRAVTRLCTELSPSVCDRPLQGDTPTVDLVLGYNRANQSPVLKLLLSRLDELVARVSKRAD